VILWTRIDDSTKDSEDVSWLIAEDETLTRVVAMGEASTGPDVDYTVKVDVEGLTAGTTYYYVFHRPDGRSQVGRTRTLPAGKVDRARIAFTSCANYGYGYFHAYKNIALRSDLDLWIHLGDYIYEYGEEDYSDPTIDRPLDPKTETISLEDYRRRYAWYRSDLDLQEVHRQHPLIVVWDDHETANNAYKDGAENHMPETEGDWEMRKKAGTQAFVEWLPIRVSGKQLPPKIYRSFTFGDLFDLLMLDTRLIGRDAQTGTDEDGDVGTPEQQMDPNRTLLGDAQTDWFLAELSASVERGSVWRLIGNQIIFSPTKDPRNGKILFADFWDGYQASRNVVRDHILDEKIDNVVFLTGDIHSSWAMDVPVDPYDPEAYDPATGEGSYAVELVGPSVTSEAIENSDLATVAPGLLTGGNPHLKFSEVTRKGYVLVDVTPERVQGEWYFMDDIKKPDVEGEKLAKAFSCASGASHLVEEKRPTLPRDDAPPPAPSPQG
jgi:alkaline phosphatase D